MEMMVGSDSESRLRGQSYAHLDMERDVEATGLGRSKQLRNAIVAGKPVLVAQAGRIPGHGQHANARQLCLGHVRGYDLGILGA